MKVKSISVPSFFLTPPHLSASRRINFHSHFTFCSFSLPHPALDRNISSTSTSTSTRHIKYFWTALEEMPAEEQSQLINFCSGRSRLPAAVSDYPMSFKLTAPPPRSKARPDDYLPIAQTCFFSLSIPEYTSLEVSAHHPFPRSPIIPIPVHLFYPSYLFTSVSFPASVGVQAQAVVCCEELGPHGRGLRVEEWT